VRIVLLHAKLDTQSPVMDEIDAGSYSSLQFGEGRRGGTRTDDAKTLAVSLFLQHGARVLRQICIHLS
jgi:hypothetical protein